LRAQRINKKQQRKDIEIFTVLPRRSAWIDGATARDPSYNGMLLPGGDPPYFRQLQRP